MQPMIILQLFYLAELLEEEEAISAAQAAALQVHCCQDQSCYRNAVTPQNEPYAGVSLEAPSVC